MNISNGMFECDQHTHNVIESLIVDISGSLFNEDSKSDVTRQTNSCMGMMNGYLEEYSFLFKEHEKTCDEVDNILQYIKSIKVPYCYEYARAYFIQKFSAIEMDLMDLHATLINFPTECEYYCDKFSDDPESVIATETMKSLDILLRWYKDRLTFIRDIISQNKDYGTYMYECSQIVPKMCSYHG